MKKPKRKRTAAERRARRERKKNFMMIFINGKQKRVRSPPTIDGMPVDEFIARNADPIWLHQEGLWEMIDYDRYSGYDSTPGDLDDRLDSKEQIL